MLHQQRSLVSQTSTGQRHKGPANKLSKRWKYNKKTRAVKNPQQAAPREHSSHSTPNPQPPQVQPMTAQDERVQAKYVSGRDITNCKWLQYEDYIGNETRSIEFKHGGDYYMHNSFPKDVCIYGCAFLNSGGGSLLVGVCDNGLVCGVNLNHKMEDNTRLLVDTGLKNLHPPLLPPNYSLHFLPVIKQGKKEHGLKVVCLTFRAPTFTDPTLYQVDRGKVYVRRDGGVEGPLGVSTILEWSRQMWTGKVHQLEQQVSELISENRFLAGQAHGLRQSIYPLHQIIRPPQPETEQTEDSPSIGQNLTPLSASQRSQSSDSLTAVKTPELQSQM